MNKREQRHVPATELRVAASGDSKTISGYAILYNTASADLGGFTEVVAPGALTETLRTKPDVLCLRDHNPMFLMGRTTSGTLSLIEDSKGLRFTCKLPNTSQAADLAESIDRGDLSGVSFGFRTVKDDWTADAAGNVVRTLQQIDLYEISPCSFPAYTATSVDIRSCPVQLRANLSRRDDPDNCECDCEQCSNDRCEDCTTGVCTSAKRSTVLSLSERNRLAMILALRLRA